MSRKRDFSMCTVERRMFVSHGTLNVDTGDVTMGKGAWQIESCNVPLFDAMHRKLGVCGSCLKGWHVDENAPTEKGKRQIEKARKAA